MGSRADFVYLQSREAIYSWLETPPCISAGSSGPRVMFAPAGSRGRGCWSWWRSRPVLRRSGLSSAAMLHRHSRVDLSPAWGNPVWLTAWSLRAGPFGWRCQDITPWRRSRVVLSR